MKDESDLEESQFVDAVERRLRFGRMMILIIGDGIQEGVEALTAHLQLHAGIHAGLALLDLSIWEGIDGGLLIVPRIPLRTVLVERGIVVVDPASGARVDPPVAGRPQPAVSTRTVAISEPEFYDQLEQRRPGLSKSLRPFVDSLIDQGVVPEVEGKSLYLRWRPSEGGVVSLATIEPTGRVWFAKASRDSRRVGMPVAGENYLQAVAHVVGGVVKQYENGSRDVVGPDARAVDLKALLDSSETWGDVIARFIKETPPAPQDELTQSRNSAI